MSADAKIEHLKMIQGVISRMAGNLFFLKGWSITVVAALFAISAKDTNEYYILVAYIPVLAFWVLDGYFLSQERLFRGLYAHVTELSPKDINFSMDITPFKKDEKNGWWNSIWSPTLIWFYLPFVTIMIIAMSIIRY